MEWGVLGTELMMVVCERYVAIVDGTAGVADGNTINHNVDHVHHCYVLFHSGYFGLSDH